jgi:hypothetical protein
MAKATETDPFDFAEGWQPEPGSTVIGKVDTLDVGENQYGRYPIVTIVQDNGERLAIHAFHTVLRNAFKKTRPIPGVKIAVRYVGEVTEDKQGAKLATPYHGYQVRLMDQSAADFWGSPPKEDDWVSDDAPF